MKEPAYYKGREQTYIKHFFLEKYLERVAYNIASFRDTFIYVDGFSGPWKSADEELADTSFAIAVDRLKKVKKGVKERFGKDLKIYCLFNESDPDAYSELEEFCRDIDEIVVTPRNQEFEELIPELLDFIGQEFSLTFIDPTGLSGFGMKAITPLLNVRGEVIVNFMMDYANRFFEDEEASKRLKLDQTFGDNLWLGEVYAYIEAGFSRETSLLLTYRKRLKEAGNFPFATSTRILYPASDRTYFHLVYGTRHRKGIEEFRVVEKKSVREQEKVRSEAKLAKQESRTDQINFLRDLDPGGINPSFGFEEERNANHAQAEKFIRGQIKLRGRMKYEDLDAATMQIPLICRTTFNEILLGLKSGGYIEILGMKPRERTPKKGHLLVNKNL